MYGRIGGNTIAEIQTSTSEKNEIGERIHTWTTVVSLKGWLDFGSGEARRTTYKSKLDESTHVFVCDFVQLPSSVKAESCRMVVSGEVFDIVYIDNPMGLGNASQLEFSLKHSGGQHG